MPYTLVTGRGDNRHRSADYCCATICAIQPKTGRERISCSRVAPGLYSHSKKPLAKEGPQKGPPSLALFLPRDAGEAFPPTPRIPPRSTTCSCFPATPVTVAETTMETTRSSVEVSNAKHPRGTYRKWVFLKARDRGRFRGDDVHPCSYGDDG